MVMKFILGTVESGEVQHGIVLNGEARSGKARKKISRIFTKEEIRMLKKIAHERLDVEKIFLYDDNGKKIPRGSYSDWAKAMMGKK